MTKSLRSASGTLRLLSWVLLIFFAEILLETGVQLKSLLVTGLSIKNIMIYGFAVYVFIKTGGSLRWANSIGLRKIILIYMLLAAYAALSMTFPFVLDLGDYKLTLAATSFKNEMLDSMICMLIFTYFASKPTLGIRLLQGVLVIIGISALLTFLDATIAAGKIFGYAEFSNRTKGGMGEPNQSAAVYAMYAPLTAALAIANRKTLLNMTILALILMAILVTGSRGGMLACVVGLSFTLWTCRSYLSISKKLLIVGLIPIAAILFLALLPEYYKELIWARFFVDAKTPVSMRELSAGRSAIWAYAIDYWLKSPAIGIGWSGFFSATKVATHNVYVEYAVNLGVIGLSIFLWLWYTIFFNIKRMTRTISFPKDVRILAQGTSAAILSITTAIFFVNLYKPWLFVWIGLGICLGLLGGSAYTHQNSKRQSPIETQKYRRQVNQYHLTNIE